MGAACVAACLALMANADTAPAGAARTEALARYGAGVWQARKDRLISAAKSLEVAAKLDPDSTAALRELIPIYAGIGRENEAIRAARKVLAADPHDFDTAHLLAQLLHEAGDRAGAAAVLKPVAADAKLTAKPDMALAVYRDLARLLEALNDVPGAESALQQALAMLTQKRAAVLASGLYTPKELEAETADTYERLGRLQSAAKSFAAADESFRKAHALFANPTKAADTVGAARLEWNLAKLAAARGQPATAAANLEIFLRRKPQSAEPYELLANALRESNRVEDVVPRLREYARKDPKCQPLQAVLAVELARNPASFEQADAIFEELARSTNDPDIVRRVLRSHIETGRANRIVNDVDEAYKLLDDKDAANTAAGRFAAEKARTIASILQKEKAWSEALLRQSADDLRANAKRDTSTWHLLGTLAERHRQLDLAAALYRTVIRQRPRDASPEAYFHLVHVLRRARKPAEVAAVCRDGLQNERWTVGWLNFHLASALADLGDADDALAAADLAIKQALADQGLSYRLNKVSVLEKLGRWNDAIALAKSLLPEYTEPEQRLRIRYSLSGAYWGAGKRDEAETELRGILEDDPDHASAANDLGYHLADLGRDFAEAERLIRLAIDLDRRERYRTGDPEPENAAYLDSLGWVLFRRGKLADARDCLVKAREMPDGAADAVVWDHLGDVYFRLGDRPNAKASWQAAAKLYENDPRGQREGRLDEIKVKLRQTP